MPYARASRLSGEPQNTAGTTGGAAIGMRNWGLSIVSATSSEKFTLQPPEKGVEKTIVFNSSSTTVTPMVYASTNQTVTFTGAIGANTALPTIMKLAATKSTNMVTTVRLVGLSSTEWAVMSVYPIFTTGNGGGSVTFSTT